MRFSMSLFAFLDAEKVANRRNPSTAPPYDGYADPSCGSVLLHVEHGIDRIWLAESLFV